MKGKQDSIINLQLLKTWLKNRKVKIFLLLLLYPNIVCFTPDSTGNSNSFVDLVLGMGKYAKATYTCKGQLTSITKYSFFDYGAGFTHKIDVLNIGVRGGGFTINDAVNESQENSAYGSAYTIPAYSSFYMNPFVGLDTKYFELNGGFLWLSNLAPYGSSLNDYLAIDASDIQIAGDIRIGNKEAFHFTSQYLSSIPLLSGSIFDMGFGFGSNESRTMTWIGLSAGPFQNGGLSIKQNIQITDNFDLLLKGRIGQIESNLEGSISAGARYNF
ncbi:MAG: hypothetical protein KJO48_01495 [Ignavibacteria bacterium]|nr:hypothetical protein [Ignavibacteria bacterium]